MMTASITIILQRDDKTVRVDREVDLAALADLNDHAKNVAYAVRAGMSA